MNYLFQLSRDYKQRKRKFKKIYDKENIGRLKKNIFFVLPRQHERREYNVPFYIIKNQTENKKKNTKKWEENKKSPKSQLKPQ